MSTGRITTPLFGLGLVDAVPDEALLALARRQARNTPSTRGTANMVTEIRHRRDPRRSLRLEGAGPDAASVLG